MGCYNILLLLGQFSFHISTADASFVAAVVRMPCEKITCQVSSDVIGSEAKVPARTE